MTSLSKQQEEARIDWWQLHQVKCPVWLCNPRRAHESGKCDCKCTCEADENINDIISRTRKDLLDEIEAGLPAPKYQAALSHHTTVPDGDRPSASQIEVIGWNRYYITVCSLLKTLREGISSKEEGV